MAVGGTASALTQGRAAIAGFHDGIPPLAAAERQMLKSVADDEPGLPRLLGAGGLVGCKAWADDNLVMEIVRRTLTAARPDKIILFGSAAAGPMTRDSDIDLLIVEPAPQNTRHRSVEIRDALGDIGYPIDVIVIRSQWFEETKDVIGGIAHPANKYGRVIYEAA